MDFAWLVARALAEDIGDGDVTSLATVPEAARAVATITQKAPGVLYGFDVAHAAFAGLDPDVVFERLGVEGEWSDGGPVLRVTGRTRALLGAERVALNFLQRLSGIATLTRRYVDAIEGTGVKILDTRKTTPGLRELEKAAVVAGGGHANRFGLFDMVLIKENHVAAAGGVAAAVRAGLTAYPDLPLEVECRTMDEVAEAVRAEAPRILLDNMTPAQLAVAVEHVGGRAETDASGGITLETVRDFAIPGLDWMSVGALTHSAPALDLSLLLEPLP